MLSDWRFQYYLYSASPVCDGVISNPPPSVFLVLHTAPFTCVPAAAPLLVTGDSHWKDYWICNLEAPVLAMESWNAPEDDSFSDIIVQLSWVLKKRKENSKELILIYHRCSFNFSTHCQFRSNCNSNRKDVFYYFGALSNMLIWKLNIININSL